MKFILIVSILTGLYVCAMDCYEKYTSKIVATSSNYIVAQIDGEVNNPGIYYFYKEATLSDLINSAGGLTSEAEKDNLNLNESLDNGKVYNINRKEATIVKVSINKGTLNQLKTVPYIGNSLAAKIIEYRLENGLFQDLEDIKKVSGIKDALFEKIKDYLTL